MGVTDILAYLLVSIKTGYAGKQKYTYTRYNTFCLEILNLLYKQELIDGYTIDVLNRKVKIKLKYYNNRPIISKLDLLTSPSLKNFSNCNTLKNIVKNYDYFYVFTSKGLISSQKASIITDLNIGGQPLFGLKIYVD